VTPAEVKKVLAAVPVELLLEALPLELRSMCKACETFADMSTELDRARTAYERGAAGAAFNPLPTSEQLSNAEHRYQVARRAILREALAAAKVLAGAAAGVELEGHGTRRSVR